MHLRTSPYSWHGHFSITYLVVNNRIIIVPARDGAMAVRRSLYLAVGAAAAPVGLCASAMAPVAGVLAGAIAVGLVLLVTAAGALLAADWRAEVGSRQAWAEVASAWAEGNSGVGLESA